MITKRERIRKLLKHFRNRVLAAGGHAKPVLIFGEQRSGTNMLLRCFDRSLDVAIYNETDDDAFEDYELRDLASIQRLIDASPASHVVLKPTADGNRALEIISTLRGSRSFWIFRSYRDVVGSALVQFEETSLQYLHKVASGSATARWRSINVTAQDRAHIKSHLDRGISEESARALIWALRNSFFFRHSLHERSDVMLLSYEDLVRYPVEVVGAAYKFVDLEFRPAFVNAVFSSSVGRHRNVQLDPEIESFSNEILSRLNHANLATAPQAASIA